MNTPIGPIGSRIAQHVAEMPAMWIVVWIGLVVLSVALLLLTRTRWGQSQPLRKCAVLSVLAHVLLGCIATTVQIVSGVTGTADVPAVRVSIVHGPQTTDDRADPSKPQSPQPWAAVTTDVATEPDVGQLARADHPSPPESSPSNLPSVQGVPDELIAQATKIASPRAPDVMAISDTEPHAGAAAQPIPMPTPQRQDPPDSESILPTPNAQRATDVALPDIGDRKVPVQPLPRPIERVMPKARSDASPNEVSDPVLTARSSGTQSRAASPVPAQMTGTAQGTKPELPDLYRDRTSRDRDDLVSARGGSGDTEAAVRAALKWLANNQEADGRWSAAQHGAGREQAVTGHDRKGAGMRADTGITGLALLAFLGAGHTHLDGAHRKAVQRGLEYLLHQQKPSGNLAGDATLFARMYCHAMATFALSESYAMTGDERLLSATERAVRYCVAAQDAATGGWRYQPGDQGDTSQLGWQVMALRSARLAGIEVPDETWHRVRRFLRSVSSGAHGGLASYRPRSAPSRTMTAEALVCRQLSGQALGNRADQEAVDYLLRELPGTGRVNLYYWYYATIGLFQHQGSGWESWNRALAAALVERQETTGAAAGSWPTDTVWGGSGGRVYTTALGAMCLEAYYRYARPAEVTASRRRRTR